ncbi:hypothetical protein KOR42_50850 [Thalassoglobus neptunius]|uniref:Leucine Rich repeats (2 copies) n=1 Tax=Thalassoglobus neptunius TaxID=1938619 RepID=A0A5C5VQ94_9PLAN|nr:hypothetical protein [Thalassoglobus neptunius]TWT39879.1 hypothetical protein KOR42_50850 [Thalassoglobus neptunius]
MDRVKRGVVNCVLLGFGVALSGAALQFSSSPTPTLDQLVFCGCAKLHVGVNPQNLVSVEFKNCQIDEALVSELVSRKTIGALSLRDCNVQTNSLRILAESLDLKRLEVDAGSFDSAQEFERLLSQLHLESLSLKKVAVTDSQLREINFSNLKQVTVESCDNLSLESLEYLASAPKISFLNFQGLSLSKNDFQRVRSRHPDVEINVDPADFKEFSALVEVDAKMDLDDSLGLVGITIENRKIDEEVFRTVDVSRLEHLALNRCHISKPLLASIGAIKSLKTLSLKQSRVSPAGLKHLQRLSQLIVLNLDDVYSRRSHELVLPELPGLQFLFANSLSFSDAMFEQLQPMSLRFLSLGPGVTEAAIRKLAADQLRTLALCGWHVDEKLLQCVLCSHEVSDLILVDCSVDQMDLDDPELFDHLNSLRLIKSSVPQSTLLQLTQIAPSLAIHASFE